MAQAKYGLAVFAKETPDKELMIFGDRRITYAEGNRRVNRLANGLLSLGLKESERVAILSYNCPEYLEISLACAKIKAAFVPVNYRLKENEVEYVINNSEARVLFCDEDNIDLAKNLRPLLKNIINGGFIVIGGEAEGMVSCDDFMSRFSEDEPEVTDSHVVSGVMAYTSGTTGRPKGVFNKSPRAEMSKVIAREFGFTSDDIHLAAGPFYHAAPMQAATREIMMGATVIIMRKMDPKKYLQIIQEEKVNAAFVAPIHLRYLMDLPKHELEKYDVSSMRRIIVAGSPCPFELKKEVIEYFGEGILLEYYGSTDVGVNTFLKPEDQLRKPGSIGKLFTGNEIIIVDKDNNPLPPNEIGELLIYNPWMLDSYFGDPEFTAKSFHGKYWRSGDLGYVDDEGYYYVVDRVKDMIISGGVNIYPVEIENAILDHPKVFDCCVLGVPDRVYGEAVKAVVQPKDGIEAIEDEALLEKEIIQWVGGKLADYKRPKSVDFSNDLPRDMSGKIRKRYLREKYWEGHDKKV